MAFTDVTRFIPAHVIDSFDRPIWGLLTRPEDVLLVDEIVSWRGENYRVRAGIDHRIAGETVARQVVLDREGAIP